MMFKFRNADFLMAKRSKQRSTRQNKDRSGCMSGIISVFDFRHGRINRRMLSDHTTHMTESVMGPSYPTSEVNSVTDSEEMHLEIKSLNDEKFETIQTRVKELMEEEMQGDHIEKPSSRSFGSREVSIDQEVSYRKPPQFRDLEDLMNELLLIHHKRNEEQRPKSLERSNSLENERGNPRSSDEPVIRKNRNFFRRRSKSHECISLNNDNESPLPSNKTKELHNERSVSQFSLTEIKKKLKNTIGRSTRDSGGREKPVVDGNSGWSSPNRDHFHSERFSRVSNRFKGEDLVSGLGKSERKPRENVEFGDTSCRISNIYVEAKKHLSEMLSNGDEDTEFTVHRHSRTLGKLLSIPDYETISSGITPKNEPECGVVTTPCENLPMVNEGQTLVLDDEHQEPEVTYGVHPTEGVVQIVKQSSSEDSEVFDASDSTEEDELSCSPMASPSGSSPAINRKTKEVESILDDKACKPSPVSVLEPLFSDEDISPSRIISRSTEASIQPLRIRFEETTTVENQETCIRNHVENEESAFEYVEAVLLASDLNWDEFEKRWLSSIQILDPSLYDELRIFSSRPGHDQRLLFDSTNEILKEICDHSFGFFPELPFGKPKIHRLPIGMNLINEVWKRLESRLDGPCSRSLDQLIKKDLEVSRAWIDLCLETREIVVEMEESIFEDMIDDTLLSIEHD